MTAWNERLKSRMKERKTTQEDLAAILDISQSSVGHYVSGRRNPRKVVLEKIADELEVSMDWLLAKTELPPIDKRDFFPVPVLSAVDAAEKLLKPAKYVNKITIKKEVRAGKPQPNKVSKRFPKKHRGNKRIKSIEKAIKLSLSDKKQ